MSGLGKLEGPRVRSDLAQPGPLWPATAPLVVHSGKHPPLASPRLIMLFSGGVTFRILHAPFKLGVEHAQ